MSSCLLKEDHCPLCLLPPKRNCLVLTGHDDDDDDQVKENKNSPFHHPLELMGAQTLVTLHSNLIQLASFHASLSSSFVYFVS